MAQRNDKPWWQPGVTAMGLLVGWLPTAALSHLLFSLIKRRARKLPAEDALRFIFELDRRMYHLTGRQAVRYGRGVHPKHRHLDYHRFFINRIQQGQRVLDVGCGHGAVAVDIAEQAGAHVTGMDYNATSIAQAKRDHAHPRVTYLEGDIHRDTPPEVFDVVMLSNVLEHLQDRPALLRKLVERHRPGKVLIRVPCFDRDWRVPLRAELGVDSRLDADHKIEYTAATFREEMRQAGLREHSLEVRWGEVWAELRPLSGSGA